jgi:hypothetical protein
METDQKAIGFYLKHVFSIFRAFYGLQSMTPRLGSGTNQLIIADIPT